MKITKFSNSVILALLITGFAFSAPAFAKKNDQDHKKQNHDERKYEKNQVKLKQHEQRNNDDSDINVQVDVYFGNEDRAIVRDYYDKREQKGHCPPGLAKKRNGCMPPGQAKEWHKGRPLPSNVIYYEFPPDVVVKLRLPPFGHKYVRVAADILLIAIGTGIVVDAIEDLARF